MGSSQEPVLLTTQQKKDVQQMWAIVRNGDLKTTGVNMYMHLFGKHPELLPMFAFADTDNLEELRVSPRLHRHAMNLMRTVGAAIDLLDNTVTLSATLCDLGKRHIKYKAKPEHFAPVGEALKFTVSKSLGQEFTEAWSHSWDCFFNLVVHYTKEGLLSKSDVLDNTPQNETEQMTKDLDNALKELNQTREDLELTKRQLEDARSYQNAGKSEAPTLTEDQKQIVRDIWKIVEARGVRTTGINMYMHLFKNNPHLMKDFSFVDRETPEELKESPRFLRHAGSLMRSVATAIKALDTPDKLVDSLHALGYRHINYNSKPEHFKPVGAALVHTVSLTLGSDWTEERQEAFVALYAVVVHYVNEGLSGAYGFKRALKELKETREELAKTKKQFAENRVPTLTIAEKQTVREIWRIVQSKDTQTTGVNMYMHLFGNNPHLMKLFSFIQFESLEELRGSAKLHRHADKLIKSVGAAIDALDTPDQLIDTLHALGKRHINYGVKYEQFKAVGDALTHAVSEALGQQEWTESRAEAWKNLYTVVVFYTNEGLTGAQTRSKKSQQEVENHGFFYGMYLRIGELLGLV